MKYKGMIVLLLLTLIISACSSNKEQSHQEHSSNGDLQEKTASADVLPTFLKGQSEEVRLVYQAAGKSIELLQWIPCYCGCAESAGHKSNMNCFVKKINKDGSVVWDDHGTRCGVCLQIAAESIKMKQEGKSIKEIRYYIDEKYKEGYAKPTKTPMPL
jgi:hypothetical protein